jgi:hypothetical protein
VSRALVARLLLLSLLWSSQVAAATPNSTPADTCTYRRCALAVVPAWNGLDLVRGENEEHVARLGFFWARDISPLFAGDPRSHEYARRAVRVRRVAVIFTDAGAVLLVAGLAGLAGDHHDDNARVIAVAGVVSFGIGVPIQFAADGHLGRAVWWHNARLSH